ncbi:hypothetical protein CCH79_00017389 [Gambusia affinis]|nr:hypothetical protein CCH79_00017389 [Gambusia affinis]
MRSLPPTSCFLPCPASAPRHPSSLQGGATVHARSCPDYCGNEKASTSVQLEGPDRGFWVRWKLLRSQRRRATKRVKTESTLEAPLTSLLLFLLRLKRRAMARGQQKIQSQQKNAKKAAEKKKSHGADQKTAAKAALVHTCPVCRTQMPDPKTFKQHFESKHPKSPMPPELADVQA